MDPHALDDRVVAIVVICGLQGGGRSDAIMCRRHACTGGRTVRTDMQVVKSWLW